MTWSQFNAKKWWAGNLWKSFGGLQGSSSWLFAVEGMDWGGDVTDDFASCCDEFFCGLSILKTKDIAISFRGLLPSVIEGEEIELVDSYKYLLLIGNYASRIIQE